MEIRFASSNDLISINDIYNYFVVNALSTFDVESCTLETRRKWFESYQQTGPYHLLVAVEDNQIIGWACNSRYRDHIAFASTTELTAYVHPQHHKKGVGNALYSRLFDLILQKKQFHAVVAGIALPNEGSIKLHRQFGMKEIGIFKEYARKNGQYISSCWMQKILST